MALFEPLFAALRQGGCATWSSGGVATVLHDHARLTADVDLVVDLQPIECRRVVDGSKRRA